MKPGAKLKSPLPPAGPPLLAGEPMTPPRPSPQAERERTLWARALVLLSPLVPWLVFPTESEGERPTRLTWTGPTGPLYRRDSSGTLRWYVYDGLGSVLGEVDAAGTLQATRTCDVYGAARTVIGTPTSKHAFVGNLGHPSEDETGLIYMRARYLDPVVGRIASEDPSGAGVNHYLYAAQDPTGALDRDGRSIQGVNAFLYMLLSEVGTDSEAGQILGAIIAALGRGMGAEAAAEKLMEIAAANLKNVVSGMTAESMKLYAETMKKLATNDLWTSFGIAKAAYGLIGLAKSIDTTSLLMQAAVYMVVLSIDGGFPGAS